MTLADERALLHRAQTSAAGFGELFDAYYDRIYAYAYRRVGSREIAEDIATGVFEDALRGIKRVHWQGKPIAAWLYRIAARRVADFYRARKNDAPLDEFAHIASNNIGDALERDEERATIQRGLQKLNASEREIIRLVYFDELDGATIASLLNVTKSNVYVRTHRALKKLEVILCD
ncbi:MAG: sigma-70 family RNA polymerase sigma factor [Anaerolineales bacterium]|nr:sigma-70 family RNA polymerase sigma factor [Anaerolineales bacterium]